MINLLALYYLIYILAIYIYQGKFIFCERLTEPNRSCSARAFGYMFLNLLGAMMLWVVIFGNARLIRREMKM